MAAFLTRVSSFRRGKRILHTYFTECSTVAHEDRERLTVIWWQKDELDYFRISISSAPWTHLIFNQYLQQNIFDLHTYTIS